MDKKKKPVCLHYHIFKNGGTTIEWIVERNFPNKTINIDTGITKGILSNDVILEYLSSHPDVKTISSHQIRFPLPISNIYEFIPIFFLRHPIDRIFSIYKFNKYRPDVNDPGVVKAKNLSFNDYVKWNLDQKRLKVMKNFQVLFLSDKPINTAVDEKDFDIAMERIRSCLILGVLNRFDESLVLGEEVLQKYFDSIDLSYRKQNITENKVKEFDDSLDGIKNSLKPYIFDDILKENQFDLKLYSEANKELDHRIENLDDYNEKMNNFVERCRKKNSILSKMFSRKIQTRRILYSQEKKMFV